MSTTNTHYVDSHFRDFATSLEAAIRRYNQPDDETLLEQQERQMDRLVSLEQEFMDVLAAHSSGPRALKKFVKYICDERRNVLAARPYFRERQESFTAFVSPALKARDFEALVDFRINYRFVSWIERALPWRPGSKVVKLAREIERVRTEVVEMNLPLAISRARIFWSRTPQAHLSYMDLVQIAAEGLLAGVDKFVPPFSRRFRAVAIGRMVGNFIEEYSETLLHFYPGDKRKLYRANKVASRSGGDVDYKALATKVNLDADCPSKKTTPAEIRDLMRAASPVSFDSGDDPMGTGGGCSSSIPPAPDLARPDLRVEEFEARNVVQRAIDQLSVFDQKLLKLKGIDLCEL